jgi:hypothetical protein
VDLELFVKIPGKQFIGEVFALMRHTGNVFIKSGLYLGKEAYRIDIQISRETFPKINSWNY